MSEWMYRATLSRVSFEATRDLAIEDGFICRSAFEEGGARADNTQHVQFRDFIHIYFTGDGEPKTIGTFEVVGPNRHPHGSWFKRGVAQTRLFEVEDENFARRLRSLPGKDGPGYGPDPVLKKMTGWLVLKAENVATPPFVAEAFTARSTLARR